MIDHSPSYISSRHRELEEIFRTRNMRMDEWEIAYRQLRPRSQPGYTPIPSNVARTTVDFVTAMLSGHGSLQIHVPILHDDSETAQEIAAHKEWWLRGVLAQYDRVLPRVNRHPSLQFNLAQDIALRGWYAVRPLLIEGAKNPFQIAVYDPRQTVHWSSEEGLLEFSVKQKLKWSDVWGQLSEYMMDAGMKPEDTAPNVEMDTIDHWVNHNGKVYNIISVNDKIVKDDLTHFEEIPVIIGPVAGVGVRTGIGELDVPFNAADPLSRGYFDQSYISTAGLSVADGILAQSQAMSLIMSMLMSNFEKWVNPPKIIYAPDNVIPTLDFRPDGVNFVPYSSAMAKPEIAELRHQGPPPETLPLLQQLDAGIQRGSIPYSFFGALGQNISGFAVSQLMKSAGYIANPRADALCHVYREICHKLLTQYSKFTEPLSGVYYYDQKLRKTFNPDLMPEDAKADGRCDVEITLRLDQPDDMIQKANIAQILRSGQRGPVASHFWVLENVIQVDDSYAEMERVALENVELDPNNPAGPQMKLVRALSIYEKRAAEGDIEAARYVKVISDALGLNEAQLSAATMQAMMAAQGPPPGGPPGMGGPEMGGGPPMGGEMAPMRDDILAEGGAPPGFPGVNGMVQPPVMSGAVPPGQVPVGDQGVPEESASILDELRGMGVL